MSESSLSDDARAWLELETFLSTVGDSIATTGIEEVFQSAQTEEELKAFQPSPVELRMLYVRHKSNIDRVVQCLADSGPLRPLLLDEARCLDWMIYHSRKFVMSHLTCGFPMYETIFPFPHAGKENRIQETAKWLLTVWWPNGGMEQALQAPQ